MGREQTFSASTSFISGEETEGRVEKRNCELELKLYLRNEKRGGKNCDFRKKDPRRREEQGKSWKTQSLTYIVPSAKLFTEIEKIKKNGENHVPGKP